MNINTLQINPEIKTIIILSPNDVLYSTEYFKKGMEDSDTDTSYDKMVKYKRLGFEHASGLNIVQLFNVSLNALDEAQTPLVYGKIIHSPDNALVLLNANMFVSHITIPVDMIHKDYHYMAQDPTSMWYLYDAQPCLNIDPEDAGDGEWVADEDDSTKVLCVSELLHISLDPLGWSNSLHEKTNDGWVRVSPNIEGN